MPYKWELATFICAFFKMLEESFVHHHHHQLIVYDIVQMLFLFQPDFITRPIKTFSDIAEYHAIESIVLISSIIIIRDNDLDFQFFSSFVVLFFYQSNRFCFWHLILKYTHRSWTKRAHTRLIFPLILCIYSEKFL